MVNKNECVVAFSSEGLVIRPGICAIYGNEYKNNSTMRGGGRNDVIVSGYWLLVHLTYIYKHNSLYLSYLW